MSGFLRVRAIRILAMLGLSIMAAAPGTAGQLTRVPMITPLPPRPDIPIIPVIPAGDDVSIIVGATGGYVLQLPGFTSKGATELASGYRQGPSSVAPVVAVGPTGTLIAFAPGDMPQERILLPEPGWRGMGVPRAISVAAKGDAIYGVDSSAGTVWRQDYATKELRTFGSKGDSPCQLSLPEQVAVDAQGRIYIADRNRIIRIDDISGTGWATYGKPGGGRGQFSYIKGLAVDSKSRIYAVDINNDRLVRIDNMLGDGWQEVRFSDPNCLAIDHRDRIYVCEAESWKLTRLDDMSGTARSDIVFSAGSDWHYGSFGRVAILPRGDADRAPIR